MEYLISHLLTNVLGPQLLPRAAASPWPYARGNVVPPMKTAQNERYEVAGGGKPLWANRAYGNMTGIVRTTVPIWSNEHAAGAVRPEYVPQS